MVLLHTCGGVGNHMPSWAARLQSIGCASVIVDSFTPRGGSACSVPIYYPATLDQVAGDAFAALAWPRSRPDIDPERIGVMGFSYAASCAAKVAQLGAEGRPSAIHLYPNANHVFDVRQPVAAAKAFEDLKAFLTLHLGGTAR